MSEIPLSQNSYAFILGLCLLFLFLPYPVWPQAFPVELFQATLTIERTDTNTICEEGEISKDILLFGFDQPERIISLPESSGFCLMASFDPNNTIADGRTFAHEHYGGNEEWMVAFLPSRPLRGTWGIKVIYPKPHITGDLRLTWKPKGSDGFPPGRFFIRRDFQNVRETKGINMKDVSFAIMEDVTNDEIVRIEYYHDSCLFDTDIPSKEDSYEPDDDLNHATIYSDQEQIHTLHDPNDTDWIEFWAFPEKKYYIYLTLVCSPPIDTNIIPFEVSLVVNGSPMPIPPLDLILLNPHVYLKSLENESKDDALAYVGIKINPELEYLGFIPYQFSLEETYLGIDIVQQKLKISEVKSKYIEHVYLKSNVSHEICSPLPYGFDPNNQNVLIYKFFCNFDTASDSFSLWLSDKVLDDNYDVRPTIVDLDGYIPDSHPPPPNDADWDCDGIFGEEDPCPNRPNIVLRAGMNLYHHPFHPIYQGKIAKKIDLCKHFNTYLLPDSSLRSSSASLFIKQAETVGAGWNHYLIDSDCTDNIFLSNKAGCLLYLPNDPEDPNDRILSNEKGNWGMCFSEMLFDEPEFDPNDPNNLMIELAPGLNIIGLTHYEAFTFEENKGTEFRTFGDRCVDSFALLQSINSPTTSMESPVLSVDPYVSIYSPKAQVYPEHNISSSVLRYDSRGGKWSYCTSFFGHLSGDRFDIGIDEAYLVYFNMQDSNNNLQHPDNTPQDSNNKQQDPNRVRGKNWYPAIFFWP